MPRSKRRGGRSSEPTRQSVPAPADGRQGGGQKASGQAEAGSSQELLDRITRAAQAGDTKQVAELISITASYSGPIPHPDLLKDYEAVVPGAADRIMRWAEDQKAHRQQLEEQEFLAEKTERARGQHYALVIALAVVGGAIVCAWLGYPWVSGVLSVAGFGAIGAPAAINLFRRQGPGGR